MFPTQSLGAQGITLGYTSSTGPNGAAGTSDAGPFKCHPVVFRAGECGTGVRVGCEVQFFMNARHAPLTSELSLWSASDI